MISQSKKIQHYIIDRGKIHRNYQRSYKILSRYRIGLTIK